MNKNLRFPLYAFFLLSLFGCSDNLTNSKAEKLVKEGTTYPKTEDVPIEYGLIGYDRDSLPGFYYLLQQKGMFRVEHLGKGGFLVISYRFRVTPTAAAKKYITKEDQSPVKQGGEFMYNSRFKTCEVAFDDIQTVQEFPAFNGADITYTEKRFNFTPFWSYYLDGKHKIPDTIQERKFGVIKTTDGWKPGRLGD